MRYRLGVDVGGTFTDLVLLAESSGLDTIFDGAKPRDLPVPEPSTFVLALGPSGRGDDDMTSRHPDDVGDAAGSR